MLDIGTGDGGYVLDRSRREPRTLVVGIDADASAMRTAARRAAARESRGGRPNALFVAAPAEDLTEFRASAHEAVVLFPWGSLLRGVLGREPGVLASIASVLGPAATLTVLFSIVDRDGVTVPAEDDLREAYRATGLSVESVAEISPAQVHSIRSSWARRLGVGRRRPAWKISARRVDGDATAR